MSLNKSYNDNHNNITLWLFCIILLLSISPFITHAFLKFDLSVSILSEKISVLTYNVLVLTIAMVTALLCYIDFAARKDISSPVLGIAILCSTVFDSITILYETGIVTSHFLNQKDEDMRIFFSLFSRGFHAGSLFIGILFFYKKSGVITPTREAKHFVIFMSLILFLLTATGINILLNTITVPRLQFDNLFISRPFDLLPLIVYLILAIFLLPNFIKHYKSVFTTALLLSLIPASILQLHLSTENIHSHNSDYVIELYLKTLTYLIPFSGILINYYITVRKEINTQTLLSSIFNTTPSGIIAYSSIRNGSNEIIDFEIIHFNKTAQILNPHYTNWNHGYMSDLFKNNWENGLFEKYIDVVENNSIMDVELYALPHCRWYRITASKLNDGITAVFSDITTFKGYETDLEERLKELNRSNSELEEFAYIASHDLQEPLRKIQTFSTRLLETDSQQLTTKSKDYINRMNNAALRMQSLIKDLMEYSRVSKKIVAEELVDINDIWDEVKSDLDMIIEQKKVILRASNLPRIVTNKLRFQQLLFNLVTNAIKFSSPHRTPEILFSYSITQLPDNTMQAGDWHTFILKDNGIGFDDIYSEKIFQLFQRLHNKETYSGSGIGLAICKKIIEQFEGKITVSSKQNEGTIFTIYLPIK